MSRSPSPPPTSANYYCRDTNVSGEPYPSLSVDGETSSNGYIPYQSFPYANEELHPIIQFDEFHCWDAAGGCGTSLDSSSIDTNDTECIPTHGTTASGRSVLYDSSTTQSLQINGSTGTRGDKFNVSSPNISRWDLGPIDDEMLHNTLSTSGIGQSIQIHSHEDQPGTSESSTKFSTSRVEGYSMPDRIDTTHLSDLPCHTAPSSEANDINYHNEKAPVGIQPSTSRQKKSFSCPDGSCQRAFTTKFRLRTHINRFHTKSELQQRYSCQKCLYETVYKTDLPRHRRFKHPAA